MSNPYAKTLYCIICGNEVSLERKKKRSITCCDAHALERKNDLRQRKEMKACKYCGQPSTPALREEFKLWRRERRAKLHQIDKQLRQARTA